MTASCPYMTKSQENNLYFRSWVKDSQSDTHLQIQMIVERLIFPCSLHSSHSTPAAGEFQTTKNSPGFVSQQMLFYKFLTHLIYLYFCGPKKQMKTIGETLVSNISQLQSKGLFTNYVIFCRVVMDPPPTPPINTRRGVKVLVHYF